MTCNDMRCSWCMICIYNTSYIICSSCISVAVNCYCSLCVWYDTWYSSIMQYCCMQYESSSSIAVFVWWLREMVVKSNYASNKYCRLACLQQQQQSVPHIDVDEKKTLCEAAVCVRCKCKCYLQQQYLSSTYIWYMLLREILVYNNE